MLVGIYLMLFLIATVVFFLYGRIKFSIGYSLLILLYFILPIRLLLSSFPEVTFLPIFSNFSIISIHTLISVGWLALFLGANYNRELLHKPFLIVLALGVCSMLYNLSFQYSIQELVKLIYLLVVAVFLSVFFIRSNIPSFSFLTVISCLPVLITQFFSFILGIAKEGEADGSISFIGLYSHEAVFSIVCLIVTFSAAISILYKSNARIMTLVFLFSVFCIYTSNYRTSLIAAFPLIVSLMIFYTRFFSRAGKAVMVIVIFFTTAVLLPALILSERFSDIFIAISTLDSYMLNPIYFDRSAIQIMSGRLYFWSQFYYEYVNSDLVQRIIGSGLGAWESWAEKYAHNQFVSYLYELGLLGVAALFYIMITPVRYVLSCREIDFYSKVMCFSFILSFFILSNSTMPLWSVEGLFLLALIYGVTYSYKMKLR